MDTLMTPMPKPVIRLCAFMLVLGVLPMPYGYYTILRLAACIVFGIAAYAAKELHPVWLSWAYAFCALLFNPVIKVHFQKELWGLLDIAAAAVLIASAKKLSSPIQVSERHSK